MAKKAIEDLSELLSGFYGRWAGTAKTWFEPGSPAMSAPITGHFYKVLKAQSVGFTYNTKVHGRTAQGTAIIGKDLATNRLGMCWVDTFHTNADVMMLTRDQTAVKRGFSLTGKYALGPEDPPWGWRTTYQLKSADALEIVHYNITPDGYESLAIKIAFGRAAPAKKLPKRTRAR